MAMMVTVMVMVVVMIVVVIEESSQVVFERVEPYTKIGRANFTMSNVAKEDINECISRSKSKTKSRIV